ncbi:hypothetical protein [Parasedimentitalea psychrophila]|uniref:Uncharacterized protein n=1 Tax=Parasedimentitalea psychrophila TaxID=2997337 RepID=A0A9Y2KY84_9RHOB|nr:hypothetical protein [Parasedimentitalea psychrophila]WIY23947.1 hypothetical protein QPJ95_15100 [Parasedimentitalea psychrophila]
MSLDGSAAKEIKQQIALARKRELAFGLCFGKKIENSVFILHKTKASKILGKQAKADGETALFTFGRLTLKGKDLSVSIDGKILPGFARKARKLFMVVGLKFNIIVLDPSGQVIESDADEDEAEVGKDQAPTSPGTPPSPKTPQKGETAEDTAEAPEAPSDQPDPLAEKWKTAATKVEANLAKLGNIAGIDLTQVNALWAAIQGKAKTGAYKTALDFIGKLSDAMKTAARDAAALAKRQAMLEAKWQQASTKLTPLVAEALALGTPQSKKIQAVWALINAKVSATPPDFETALKAVGPLAKSISEARQAAPETRPEEPAPAPLQAASEDGETLTAPKPSAPEKGPSDQEPPPEVAGDSPELDLSEQIQRIEAEIKSLTDGPIASYNSLIAEAVSQTPEAWNSAFQKIAKLVSDAKATPTPDSAAKLDIGEKALIGIKRAIATETQAKTGFQKALTIFDLRLVPLTSHPKSGSSEIAPEITKIADIRAAAIEKSKTHALKAATDELTAAEPVIAITEIMADDFAHFAAIDGDRKIKADTDRGKVTGAAAVDDPAREMEGLYDAAQLDCAAKKFKDGIKKLDKIAEIFITTTTVKELKASYEKNRPIAKDWIDHWAGLAVDIKQLIAAKLAELDSCYAGSDIATTSDYSVSSQKLSPIWSVIAHLKSEIPTVQQYPPKLLTFETKLRDFKAHDGASGIQVMILKMEADLVAAKAEAALHKFSTASAVLATTETQWPASLAQANSCKSYKEKRISVQGKIEALKNVPQAASLIEAAKALMTEAALLALKCDFTVANSTLADAEKRVDNAKAAAEADLDIDALHDEAALDKSKKKWAPAFKVFTDIRDKVLAADVGNDLSAFIAKAQVPAMEAEKAHKAKKHDDARAHLDSAIANLKLAMVLVHQHRAYADIKLSLGTQVVALAPLNVDSCLQPHINNINVMIGEADDLTKPEAYDYKAAEAKLAAARKIWDQARADGEVHKQIVKLRTSATAIITSITTEGGAVAAQLAHRITEIQTLLDDGAALQIGGDFKAAAAKAKAATDWEAPTAEDMTTLKTVLGWEDPYFKVPRAALIGPGKEAGAHQVARADVDFAKYQTLKTEHIYSAAQRVFANAYQKITACKALVAMADLYHPALTDTQAATELLDGERNAATAALIKDIEDRLAATKVDETKTDLTENSYSQATKALLQITTLAKALLVKIKGSSDYETARKAAKDKLDEAQGHKHADAIAAQLIRLTTKYGNLVKLAPSDYATAKTMADELAASAEDAIKTAGNHALLEAVNAAIGGDEDSALWWPQVALAKLSIKFIASKDNADIAQKYLDLANAEIDSCQQDGLAAKEAKAHLLAALEACNAADEIMSQYGFLVQEIARAQTALSAVKTHGETAYVTTDIAEIEKLLARAETTAKTGQNFDKVSADIEAAIVMIGHALALADQHKDYTDLRAKPEVEPRLAELEGHEHRYAIKPSIDAIRQKLVDAAAQMEARKPPEAIKLLEEVRAIGTSAFVMAQMRANTPPEPKDIEEILSRPNGTAELDAMIDNLEPEAQRAVVKVAFKARFGCDIKNFSQENLAPGSKIEDNNLQGPNIVAFYKAMQDLPLDHTLDNDSMSKFAVNEHKDGGSLYDGSEKRIVMHEGDAATSSARPLAGEDAVGSLEDAATPEERAELEKCKPANDDPVTFFNWNTMHEVGHAVDDKTGFMTRNGSGKDYGGWTEYGADTSVIADKIAKKFQYDKSYVTSYLAHKENPYTPAKPSDEACSDEEWESRRIQVRAHIEAASESANPWASMSGAKKIAIDGVVYQESYANTWTSYLLDARPKGITGYQFRAPGEWFSEMYAAYYSGKLKPNHPAVSWLAKL